MTGLHGRTALVTGGSRGIGATTAKLLAAHGAAVAVNGRDADAVAAMTAEIAEEGGRAMAAVGDVTRFEQVEAMRESIEHTLGPVDVLVANAGGSPVRPGPLEDISDADWWRSVDLNLTSTFVTIKAFLPGMKQRRRGTIVTMSSAAARRPTAQSPVAYAAAKAGIEVLTKEAALQAGPHGVRVNCVAPETILTERNRQSIPDDVQVQMRQAHPIQRLGTPEDVAHAVLFLVSEESAWVSGVVLDVAGGSVLA
jgi:3-oxoacyl-[acyl-carrier protein] reductase